MPKKVPINKRKSIPEFRWPVDMPPDTNALGKKGRKRVSKTIEPYLNDPSELEDILDQISDWVARYKKAKKTEKTKQSFPSADTQVQNSKKILSAIKRLKDTTLDDSETKKRIFGKLGNPSSKKRERYDSGEQRFEHWIEKLEAGASYALGRAEQKSTWRSNRRFVIKLVTELGNIWQQKTGQAFSYTSKSHNSADERTWSRPFVEAVLTAAKISLSDNKLNYVMRKSREELRYGSRHSEDSDFSDAEY